MPSASEPHPPFPLTSRYAGVRRRAADRECRRAPATLAGATPAHRRPVLRVLLEIALIATGVFLGLAGDAWREREQHRDAARASLRRFRAEIVANREAVAAVRDYHVVTLASVRAYLAKDHKTRNVADVKIGDSAG